MGIHQLPKTHPQRTIQSAVMIPWLFPTCKSTVSFIYLVSVLESFAYRFPLSASLRTGLDIWPKFAWLPHCQLWAIIEEAA